jgi:hypothetical protein
MAVMIVMIVIMVMMVMVKEWISHSLATTPMQF